jgi:hypothetical protein
MKLTACAICVSLICLSFSSTNSLANYQEKPVTLRYKCGAFEVMEVEYSVDGKTATIKPSRVLTAQPVDSGFLFAEPGDRAAIKGTSHKDISIKVGRGRSFVKCATV